MWGQLDTLKTLVELNADFQAVNFRGEKAVDVARRYDKLDCAEYLAWAGEKVKHFSTESNLVMIKADDDFFLLTEAKQSLQALIQDVRDIIADPEKVQGKLNKEDKVNNYLLIP